MLRYWLLAVGRKNNEPWQLVIDKYAARLQHFAKFERCLVTPTDIEREGVALEKRIPDHAELICLCEHGQRLNTQTLLQHVQRWQQHGQVRRVFVVGGAFGLSAKLKAKAQAVWSLSGFTLPHLMAQAMLIEQLYRAHCIATNVPYHH